MNKNLEMLRCFFKVMRNKEGELIKVIPNMYFNSFYDINEEILLKNGINKLIIDIDGTILPVDSINVPTVLINKINSLKNHGIDMCLVSNNNINRVLPVCEKLGIDKYLAKANKPLLECFKKAMCMLDVKDRKCVAMIGDQMLSDIKGANEYGIYSILVRPIDNHQNLQTATCRTLQNIMESHLKRIKRFDKNVYYK